MKRGQFRQDIEIMVAAAGDPERWDVHDAWAIYRGSVRKVTVTRRPTGTRWRIDNPYGEMVALVTWAHIAAHFAVAHADGQLDREERDKAERIAARLKD